MCVELGELRKALCRYASAFDPALVTGPQADAVMSEAAAIESVAATLKAMAAARVAETSQWRGGADRSAAQYLARRSGTTSSAAASAIETAKRLKDLPEASAAARRG